VVRRLAWVLGDLTDGDRSVQVALQSRLSSAGWETTHDHTSADAVLVWTDDRAPVGLPTTQTATFAFGPTLTADLPALREAAGVMPRSWTPPHPARLRPEGTDAWVRRVAPLDDEIEIETPILVIDKARDSVETWLSAPVGLKRHPVVAWNPDTRTGIFAVQPATGRPGSDAEPVSAVARLLHLTLRRALGLDAADESPAMRVGLLGFGAIGAEHARAALRLPGLQLGAVCDRNDERLASVASIAPDIETTTDPDVLLDSDVDLVVVSTPPDTHADWAIKVLSAGKHVVLEKPMALTVTEADAVMAAAASADRRVVTYQNRRFDPDFLAVRGVVDAGAIGDIFHVETFIGGYGHPCNYWHSDADVSGGAIYDWGSHVLDQVLALHPEPIEHVSCVEHKRRWFDVTNADHSSLLIRFADGAEASFVHSDLAAALKPRWYVLGTDGALVSRWRSERVIARTEIGTLHEDQLSVTDAPPDLYCYSPDGAETALMLPTVPSHPFHTELVDDLLYSWPMSVTAAQSRRVVAVMEAARGSADSHGAPVAVDGEPNAAR
jgi:scyllo-inositol 2-dehydrogenase (NADP+)